MTPQTNPTPAGTCAGHITDAARSFARSIEPGRPRRRRAALGTLACTAVALAAAAPAASAGWQDTVNVTPAGQSGGVPSVALNPQGAGKAVAAWGSNSQIHAALRASMFQNWLQGGSISGAFGPVSAPQVAVDAQDTRIAVWSSSQGPDVIVQSAMRSADAAWQPPVNLSLPGGKAWDAHIAMNAKGDAVVAWVRSDPGGEIVQAAMRPAGGAWQAPVSIGSPSADLTELDVAIGADGGVAVVWTNKITQRVQGSVRAAGKSWQAPVDLSSGTGSRAPDVAVDAQGNALAAWHRYNADTQTWDVQTAERPAGALWKGGTNLVANAPIATAPQVAFDRAGRATAIWARDKSGGLMAQSADRPAGGAWASPVDISNSSSWASDLQLAVNMKGDAVIAWTDVHSQWPEQPSHSVQATVRPAGGSWQPQVDLTPASGEAKYATVAIDGSGNAIVLWVRTTNINSVQSRTYAG